MPEGNAPEGIGEPVTNVVFDQSAFIKTAIETLLHEGAIGLFLTSVMILISWEARARRWRPANVRVADPPESKRH